MKRRILAALLTGCLALGLAACGEKEQAAPVKPLEGTNKGPDLSMETEPLEEEETREGMVKSYLTGEWIDEEIGKMRPYAVMIGNSSDALPQYGISKADVMYEVPVEGSFTRLMAIFQDLDGVDKLGSVRSCRHYFVYFAKEFDSLYVHYGQAIYAEELLGHEDINNISGLDGSMESLVFYRDKERKSPHNAFTTQEGLLAGTEKKGYRTEYDDAYEGHYQFADEEEPELLENGTDALVVSPGYFVNRPWFVYDPDQGIYYRYQFKKEHIDGGAPEGEQQLTTKNILIQYCGWSKLDENGYLDVNTIGSGDGKYITNGKVIDVTWKKDNEDAPARYYDGDGNEIKLNPGKTWVCVVRDSYKDRFAVYNTQEELLEARSQEQ